ncbi:hypothetical protein ACFOG5_10030 [Pedobacter fastidiosus]|uniref:Por secretion system C-terminal sorting domain-containing protein n=1 Tax=Pedobacter fastidiosus TaxID=2765361 RepID=A0ABR7KWC8_9SPHI|nr:hypothetical protein [Pedobacter fastidiosus]MBC6112424.1 hypothetical protein [Pedobacter fastidiosus]
MKNFLKISLIAAIFFTVSGARANDDVFSLKVKSEKEKNIRFFINEAKDINFSLYGEDDEKLFEENIHAVGASTKTYNLDAFPDGNYTLKVETGSKLAEYDIVIGNGLALVSAPTVIEVFKPVITKSNQVITLNVESKDKSPIKVQVFNEYNEELYSEVFTNKAQLTKKFYAGQTDSKILTFIVKSNKQTFIKNVDAN